MGKFLSGDVKQARELVIGMKLTSILRTAGFRSDAR